MNEWSPPEQHHTIHKKKCWDDYYNNFFKLQGVSNREKTKGENLNH
jgi:hypothetical protein